MYKNVKIIVDGQISYPKSEALIIPANQSGLMTRGQVASLVADGGSSVAKEAKTIANSTQLKIGDCFVTGVGRLRKRGVKHLYHAVIKRCPSDLTSITDVTSAVKNAVSKAAQDGYKSITICGIGAESGELDIFTVSGIILSTCEKFPDIIFKIIDSNSKFIEEISKMAGNKNE